MFESLQGNTLAQRCFIAWHRRSPHDWYHRHIHHITVHMSYAVLAHWQSSRKSSKTFTDISNSVDSGWFTSMSPRDMYLLIRGSVSNPCSTEHSDQYESVRTTDDVSSKGVHNSL